MEKNKILESPMLRGENEKGVSTKSMMRDVCICLLVVYAFGFWKNGVIPFMDNPDYDGRLMVLLLPIINLVVACLVAVLGEAIFFKVTKRIENFKDGMVYAVRDSYALIPPIILLLIRPVNTPIFVTVFTVLLMTFISKMLFGGFGRNIFNPAAVGAALYASAFGGMVSSEYGGWLNINETDLASGSTPLGNITGMDWVGMYDQVVAPFGSLWDFFLGFVPGAFGETSALLILLLGIVLIVRKVIPWQTPVVYLATIFFGAWLYAIIQGVPGPLLGLWYPIWYTLTGGVVFGAIFMFTEPVTSPISNRGRVIFAFFGAVLTILFRQLAGTPGGVATAIVTMNLFTSLIDNKSAIIEAATTKKPRIISALLVAVAGLSIFGLTIYKNPTTSESRESIFEEAIAGSEDIRLLEDRKSVLSDTSWQYNVSTVGYKRMTLSVIVSQKTHNISTVTIEHDESDGYGKEIIEDKEFIESLIEVANTGDFSEFDYNGISSDADLDSGATATSTGILNVLLNVRDWNMNEENIPEVYVPPACAEGFYCASGKGYYDMEIQISFVGNTISEVSFLEFNNAEGKEGPEHINESQIIDWLKGKTKSEVENLTADDIKTGATVNYTIQGVIKVVLEAFEDYEGGTN